MTLVISVVIIALIFEYINGFHDTANAIATVVSTKVLSPRQAVLLAAVCNLAGAMVGTTVATTIGKGLVDTAFVTTQTILAALVAAIIWDLVTWWLGLPCSSSHAIIGGLCGATVASATLAKVADPWSTILWWGKHAAADGEGWLHRMFTPMFTGKADGLLQKVVAPMLASPLIGIGGGFLLMTVLTIMLVKVAPRLVNLIFGKLQLVSAAWMGFSHGTNDAQKTMGIIALLLYTATTKDHSFDQLPDWLAFLRTPNFTVATWVKVVCAITMAAGTAAGGWRIIRTMGHKMVRMQPVHGFAAETTAAAIIQVASHFGVPVSTTHVISSSIMGVGATKRLSAVRWGIVGRMVWAWVLTLPITALLAYAFLRLLVAVGG